jgi:hypothetical protein
MVKYFSEYQDNGLARMSKDGEAGGNASNMLPVWGSTGAPRRVGRRASTGRSSANFHRKGVDLINKKYSFRWDLQEVPSQIQVDDASDLPEPEQTTSLKMVSALEEFYENLKTNTMALG